MNKRQLLTIFIPAILITLIIWITFFADEYFKLNLWQYGLYPRQARGLAGILTMPLLHGDIRHIINNTVPLIVLTTFLYHFYKRFFLRVYIMLWLTSGLWTWVIARPSYHIGASALIYGLAAFIFFAGILLKEKRHIAISFLIVFLYGSIIWGIFPIDLQQSWEGHLAGFLVGTTLAFYFSKELKTTYKTVIVDDDEDEDEEDDENAYWRSTDTSSKTENQSSGKAFL
jgi:membrane associated rhomboid family serine protease